MVRSSQRFRLGGTARLWVDDRGDPVSVVCRIVDLSVGGCCVLLQRRLDPHLAGRVGVHIDGETLWLPVLTRTVRKEASGWVVACDFDRPTAEKQEILRELVRQVGVSPNGK